MTTEPLQPSDDDLMARVSGADEPTAEAALHVLVERWQRRVLAFLTRCVGDREDARDLAQETFVRVWQSGRAGRYDPRDRFAPWLLRIAGNLCRSRLRRRRLVRWLPLAREPGVYDLPGPEREHADQDAREHDAQAAVEKALARLPERQRLAVVLKRFEGLSYKEIAQVLGTSPGAVESLLIRANVALREELHRAGLLE